LATVRAELAIAEERFADAIHIVSETAPRVANETPFVEMSETTWWLATVGLAAAAEKAEWARAAGDAEQLYEMLDVAEVLTAHVERARRQRDADGIPDIGTLHGHDALIAGHVARIEGRDDAALWSAAAEALPPRSVEALSARYRQAAAMLAMRSAREAIAEVVADAHATAVEIGARPLAAQCEALARRARIDLRRTGGSAVDVEAAPTDTEVEAVIPGEVALRNRGLSGREIEVLTLVAAGYSNRDIAERLFISTKTASVHVSHILDKLGVATRTEAATIGVRLGLPEVDRRDT
jgi:DNA-binding NarL/FixJ family response regulator